MNKYYTAFDEEKDTFFVMQHERGKINTICQAGEDNCKKIAHALEFLYVTAAKELELEPFFLMSKTPK